MDNRHNTTGIYAIYDKVAETIVGNLWLYNHVAAAVRTFSDILSRDDTAQGQHPADYNLVELGVLVQDQGLIIAHDKTNIVITGEAWLANRTAEQGGPKLMNGTEAR